MPKDLPDRHHLFLRTLSRGEGLLGMEPSQDFAPRGGQVTVVWMDGDDGPLQALGFSPIPLERLQWRGPQAAEDALGSNPPRLWSLKREEDFGDFYVDRVPHLRDRGWQVTTWPGFAHEPMPIAAWRLLLAGEEAEGSAAIAPGGLSLNRREGSWLLSLGVEVEGQTLDLAPLLGALLKRDARWRDKAALEEIDDEEGIRLRMPGGRHVEAPAAPLKAIVGAMLELLTDPRRAAGPLKLSTWDAGRVQALRLALAASQPRRAGPAGAWALQGEEGLKLLGERLRAAGKPEPVEPPHGLGLSLRGYQVEGLAWLQHLRAQGLAGILADDMGLGKTAQVLAHLLLEKQQGRADRPSLVVVPTSLVFNWLAEARRVAPELRVLALQGPQRHADFAAMTAHDLVITTYPLAWRDLDRLRPQPWHLLMLDEAQVTKDATGRAARAMRRLDARHRLCITGTPLENHLGELWSQFDFLMPGFLGDSSTFQRLWKKPIEVGGETARADLLARRIRPFILRRRKQDVAPELPPRVESIERVPLLGQQRMLYESVRAAADQQVRRVLQRVGFGGAQIAVLDALLKLRQVCCDPRLMRGEATPPGMERAKLDRLCEMLPPLVEEGRQVIVFSQFTALLRLAGEALSELPLPWLSLTGDTPPEERGALVARFQAGEVPVLLASLKAGGTGLNLTAADTVIHLDPWWNPAVEEQATARAHRIGQTRTVFVYRLIAEGSIEERMRELQARKAALAAGMLGADLEGVPKFGIEEVEGLLAPLDT
ncbi:ATP-dependent helicase [Xylophilus rhododendri]|uniref:ATP-dependent helicase n=1 Tax=Xylophilus rhododendri TaxID=2697032 RepID=A0A857J7K8_9BURK|nr:DEAD/DEAH box helicase [Xylophilus rhododendri]QHJ00021.1 ATP-dependent helicase [Xylophilus rhododendri]